MNIKKWYENNKVAIWMGIISTVIIVTIIVFVGGQIWYCIENPDCDMCQARNMTALVKPLTYK